MRKAVMTLMIVAITFASPCCLSAGETYNGYCDEIGAEYNICPELLEAIIEAESSGNPNAVGADGDIGLMQVVKRWHTDRMKRLGVYDLKDPYGNILVATDYLAELFEKYEDVGTVLMEYNGTPNSQSKGMAGDYTEYALSVMERSYDLERAHGK